MQQKSKLSWLKDGDENSKAFQNALKTRRLQNTIYGVADIEGRWVEGSEEVNKAFLHYYTQLLGTPRHCRSHVQQEVIDAGPVLNAEQCQALLVPFSPEEVKQAIFSIPGDKSPGPDGFGAAFYKDAWSIVGAECTTAVLDSFQSKKLLKEINHTILALIPKVKCPGNVTEFRPIACCNVIYKCITKLMCSRLSKILPEIIAANQGAFVKGRFIAHNILICQDIVKNYGKKDAAPASLY
ncbi:hypothetical protein BVRB_7g176340 [Beta vulgaris subsp. vulgaris]|nr:hypothetical protein BVRB_7g176340 [Beta vulgaris subsp. vulgaris]